MHYHAHPAVVHALAQPQQHATRVNRMHNTREAIQPTANASAAGAHADLGLTPHGVRRTPGLAGRSSVPFTDEMFDGEVRLSHDTNH